MRAWRFGVVADDADLDAVDGLNFSGDCVDLFAVQFSEEDVFSRRADAAGFCAHVVHCAGYRFRDRVCNAAFEMHFHQSCFCKSRGCAASAYVILFANGVRQKLFCEPVGEILFEICLDELYACELHRLDGVYTKLFYISKNAGPLHIGETRLVAYFNSPLFHKDNLKSHRVSETGSSLRSVFSHREHRGHRDIFSDTDLHLFSLKRLRRAGRFLRQAQDR